MLTGCAATCRGAIWSESERDTMESLRTGNEVRPSQESDDVIPVPYDEVLTADEGNRRPCNGFSDGINGIRHENGLTRHGDKRVWSADKGSIVSDEAGARADNGVRCGSKGMQRRADGARQTYKSGWRCADGIRRGEDGRARPYDATIRLADRSRWQIKACVTRLKAT
jgi:hypothetical protein